MTVDYRRYPTFQPLVTLERLKIQRVGLSSLVRKPALPLPVMAKTEIHKSADTAPFESLPAAAILLPRVQDPVGARLDAVPYDEGLHTIKGSQQTDSLCRGGICMICRASARSG